MKRLLRKSCWLLLLFPAIGCNDGMATVRGLVTYDREPIAGGPRMYGTVSFYRQDGGGAPAIGVIDASGHYALKTGTQDLVEPGSYLVSIAVKKITVPDDPNAMPVPHLMTPAKYASVTQSGLTADVVPGANSIDFALTSE